MPRANQALIHDPQVFLWNYGNQKENKPFAGIVGEQSASAQTIGAGAGAGLEIFSANMESSRAVEEKPHIECSIYLDTSQNARKKCGE